MLSVLLYLSASVCQQTFELRESYQYKSVSAHANETVCFNAVSPNTVILFKHFKHLMIVGQNKTKADQQKLVGYFFGSSSKGSIEVVPSKDTHIRFISVSLPQEIKKCFISTLVSDKIEFNGTTPTGYFHVRENSTYAINFETDINSQVLASKSQMRFSGKNTDYIKTSSELFVWLPSLTSKDSKAQITVGIPTSSSHKGYKFELDLQSSGPLYASINHTHHHDHHHGPHHGGHHGPHHGNHDKPNHDFFNDTIRYHYDNIFQNGSILFPTILSLIVTFVGIFFIILFVARFIYCCCQRRKPNSDNTRVQIHERAVVVPPTVNADNFNDNLQVMHGQPVVQMGNLPQQQIYYPVLDQPNVIQQQYIQQQPQYPMQQPPMMNQMQQPQMINQIQQPLQYPMQQPQMINQMQQIPVNQYQQPGVYH